MMNKRLSILIGAAALAGAALAVPWAKGAPPRSLSQDLTLVALARVASVDLPVEWFSLRQYEENDPTGLTTLEGFEPLGKMLADDVLGIAPEAMPAVLAALPAAPPGPPVQVPGDAGLCLHWEPAAGVLQAFNRAHDFALDPAARDRAKTLGWERNPPEAPGAPPRIPASRTAPPDTWRIAAATADLEKLPGRRSTLSGLGLLEVNANGPSRFCAGGTPHDGPNPAVEAWLHVARDDAGGLWFWFEEQPVR
ncbi:MAG: hypothetical protein D6702_02135 [Planctomycetota bacterium]|nr:MAG: hypothetical protein D6702_02135 [Planctomycetota bacterium]